MNNGSSSNPRPTQPTPRRGRGRATPQRRGHPGQFIPPPQMPPVMGVPGQSAFTPYARPSPPLLMGVPGQSAFTPYVRPPPPPSDSNRGPIGSGGAGFEGAQAVPISGSGSGDAAASGALRIGGSPAADRNRGREDGAGGAGGGAVDAAGGDQPINENQVRCTVCGRVFRTPKALFGHMRSHPDRGWKGAHPPPAFRANEEFADLQGEEAAAAEEEVEAEEEYGLPDLNKQPPRDSN